MKFFMLLYISFMLSILSTSSNAAPSEIIKKQWKDSNQFADLFMREQFDELNAISEKLRNSKERSDSGTWQLAGFYQGEEILFALAQQQPDEAGWQKISGIAQRWVEKNPSPSAYVLFVDTMFYHGCRTNQDFYYKMVHDVQNLEQAKASMDPQWYRTKINLAVCEHLPLDKAIPIFSEAIEKHKYYYDLYFEIAKYMIIEDAPVEVMNKFLDDAVNNTKAEDGMGIYARIYWATARSKGPLTSPNVYQRVVNWDKVKAGIEDVLKQYPDQWNINHFAYFACAKKDQKLTTALLDRITIPLPEVWGEDKGLYEQCKTWAQMNKN